MTTMITKSEQGCPICNHHTADTNLSAVRCRGCGFTIRRCPDGLWRTDASTAPKPERDQSAILMCMLFVPQLAIVLDNETAHFFQLCGWMAHDGKLTHDGRRLAEDLVLDEPDAPDSLKTYIRDRRCAEDGRNLILPKDVYYRTGRIDPDCCSRYDRAEARDMIVEHEHWGPWV